MHSVGSVLRNNFYSVFRRQGEHTHAGFQKMAEKENTKVKETEFIVECIRLYRELSSLWNGIVFRLRPVDLLGMGDGGGKRAALWYLSHPAVPLGYGDIHS